METLTNDFGHPDERSLSTLYLPLRPPVSLCHWSAFEFSPWFTSRLLPWPCVGQSSFEVEDTPPRVYNLGTEELGVSKVLAKFTSQKSRLFEELPGEEF